MRVLFIYPNIDCPVGVNHGLAMLSGVLKAAGHDTKLLLVNEKLYEIPTAEEVVALIEDYGPELIGYSCMSQQYDWACEVAKVVREKAPTIPQVVGGVHCTMVPDVVCSDSFFDYVCVGEGDNAILELVTALEAGTDTTRCSNMRIPASRVSFVTGLIRKGPKPLVMAGQSISNPVGSFPDLEALPAKDYELFDLDTLIDMRRGWLGVITSRGCPYKCTYCFNKEIVDLYREDGAGTAKTYLRHYPVERVIDELRTLKENHNGIETFIFDDDLFTLDRQYVLDFCEAYQASGLGLQFVVNAHVQVFDDRMAKALADAGCFMVKFGLESGSPRLRKEVLWRYMSNEKMLTAFRAAHRYGLHTTAFVMFGLPTEGRKEIEETLQLCADAELGRFRWAIFYPFPGTAGHRIAEDLGVIDHDKMSQMGNYFDGSCLNISPELNLLVEKLGRVFHWFVNARSSWGCAPFYAPLVEEVEAWTREEFDANKKDLARRDRELSEQLIAQGVRHYSLRYTHVMGVDSDYVIKEQGRCLEEATYIPVGYTLD
ncbi:MAG: radical SAM protein [Planctomycetota bacterium]|nr:radical SAM protein [Planctomycetota bacterium]